MYVNIAVEFKKHAVWRDIETNRNILVEYKNCFIDSIGRGGRLTKIWYYPFYLISFFLWLNQDRLLQVMLESLTLIEFEVI